MTKQIGPSFPGELEAAGLSQKVNSFVIGGTDADIYAPDLTGAERRALEAVIAAHDPSAQSKPPAPDPIADLAVMLRNPAKALRLKALLERD